MPSFRITVAPSRRAAGRYVSEVRRKLLRALDEEKSSGVTQSEIARRLNVHRSVISRELRGYKDITLGRVGELAWAMGRRPVFDLPRVTPVEGANITLETELPAKSDSQPLAAPVPDVATSKAAKPKLESYGDVRVLENA